jgi:hypothetical protein
VIYLPLRKVSEGLSPYRFRYTWEKRPKCVNPQSNAIELIETSGCGLSSFRRALCSRCSVKNSIGVYPLEFWKAAKSALRLQPQIPSKLTMEMFLFDPHILFCTMDNAGRDLVAMVWIKLFPLVMRQRKQGG